MTFTPFLILLIGLFVAIGYLTTGTFYGAVFGFAIIAAILLVIELIPFRR